MKAEVINLLEKMEQVEDFWTPKIVEQMNDYQFKLAKFKGEFTWHNHKETDEVFIILKGRMEILFRDKEVVLKEGEMYVIPKGVDHKPQADRECQVMIVEPAGTVNTGDVTNGLTASNKDWI